MQPSIKAIVLTLEISRCPAFGLTTGNKIGQFVPDAIVQSRGLKAGNDLFEHVMRTLSRPNTSGNLPAFVVFPIAQEGLIERRGIAVLGVLNAEEVAIISDRTNCVQRYLIRAGGYKLGSI